MIYNMAQGQKRTTDAVIVAGLTGPIGEGCKGKRMDMGRSGGEKVAHRNATHLNMKFKSGL